MRARAMDRSSDTAGAAPGTVRRVVVAVVLAVSSVSAAVAVTGQPAGAASSNVLEGWGYNQYGQIGDGTRVSRSTPEQVSLPGGATPVAVSTGGYHTLAIGSDGNLYAWGQNSDGQLGDGTTTTVGHPEGGPDAERCPGRADRCRAVGQLRHRLRWQGLRLGGRTPFDELGNGNGPPIRPYPGRSPSRAG